MKKFIFLIFFLIFACSKQEHAVPQLVQKISIPYYLNNYSYDMMIVDLNFKNNVVSIDSSIFYFESFYKYKVDLTVDKIGQPYNRDWKTKQYNFTFDGKVIKIDNKEYAYSDTKIGNFYYDNDHAIASTLDKNSPTNWMPTCTSDKGLHDISKFLNYGQGRPQNFIRCDKENNQIITLQIIPINSSTGIGIRVEKITTQGSIDIRETSFEMIKVKCYNRTMFIDQNNNAYYNTVDLAIYQKNDVCSL